MGRLFPPSRRATEVTASTTADPDSDGHPRASRRSAIIRIATTLLVVAVMAAFLVAVATNHLPRGGSATSGPARGGSIVDGVDFEPNTMLPFLAGDPQIVQALWAPLWYADPQGIFHPGLATQVPSLENGGISSDLTTLTIHLRSGLKWSDGTPLTAEDCAFTFSDQAFLAYFPILSVTSTDPTTVVVQLKPPTSLLLAFFADGWGSCVPKEIFGKMTAAQATKSPENFQPSVVSGPFMIKERVAGDHITVVRNPHYYLGPAKPYLDQITFKILTSGDGALSALQTHAIDTSWHLDYSKLPSYRAIPGYTTYLDHFPAWYEVLAFNLTDPILSDHAVRQAISMSIDRNQIITTLLYGAAKLTCDDSVGTFAHEDTLTCYPFDPLGAGTLLDGDGWTMGADGYRHKNGQTLELEYATTNRYPRGPTQALIRDELATTGMKIDLKVYAFEDFFGTNANNGNSGNPGILPRGGFQIAEFGNNNFYDPDDGSLFASDATPDTGGSNFMHYVNPEVDAQEHIQATTADMNARKAAFHIVHEDVLKDLPVMYLYAPQIISCARSDLRNYDPSPEGAEETWNVWDWWLAPHNG